MNGNFKKLRIQDHNGDLAKRWYVQYLFLNPDTLKFEPWREWVSSSLKTKTARYIAAKKLRDDLHRKLMQGFDPYTNKEMQIPLKTALQRLVELKERTARRRTFLTYKNISEQFCVFLNKSGLDNIMPHQVSKHIAQAYFDFLITGKNLSARTYNNHVRALRSLFNELIQRDACEYNVFSKIKVVEMPEPEAIAYTLEEMARIRSHLEYHFPELWLCALFVHYAFIRPQELCRLQFKNLNFENQTIQVPGNKSKNKKTQIVLMPDPLYNKLIEMAYHTMPPELYIFSNASALKPGENEISPARIFEAWQWHVQRTTKIKKGIYLFKHTGAGLLFDSGADARAIQLQLRHHSIDEAITYAQKYSQQPGKHLLKHFREIKTPDT